MSNIHEYLRLADEWALAARVALDTHDVKEARRCLIKVSQYHALVRANETREQVEREANR